MKTYYDNYRFGGNGNKALERDNHSCVKCSMTQEQHKAKYGRSLTVDHIDNKGRNAKVKNHALSNLQTLCLPCHSTKDNRGRINKITIEKIQEMKDRFMIGFQQKEIAKIMGVHINSVHMLVNDKYKKLVNA